MSPYETRRQERAAWLMYQLGLPREHADAITNTSPETNRRTLTKAIAAFRLRGIPDEEIVAWHEVGVGSASLALEWREAGYTPHEFADLRDACTPSTDNDDRVDLLYRILEEGIPHEFALLALRAGAKSPTELSDMYRREREGDPDIQAELQVLAELRA